MRSRIYLLIFILSAALFLPSFTHAVDPKSSADSGFFSNADDDKKSSDELLDEAQVLLLDDRPLDARTKLLKALDKDPSNYKTHMLLGGYYMIHVGHFRLALNYLNQARRLFEKRYGPPEYSDMALKDDHAKILYLHSETRLNLDNYKGSLQTLDEYNKYYSGSWYPGSRAWVLMKLGRVEEAIRVARLGVLMGAEPGRTLNILGILLSMTGQRENSLRVFDEAITYEYTLGSAGQPATPLNNSGEVYRETFEEERAEGSWLRAVSLPDGCEHVLPSLNLANLYIEQEKFDRAKWAMDNFEECIRQYPLRNGEEHKALVHMARGRIALHTGHIEDALEHLESATERQQWFGKIGTNANDLRVATLISLGQALSIANNHIAAKIDRKPWQWLEDAQEMISNSVRSWWLLRRARLILTEDLKDFEDLYVRNTDSMIEYHALGDITQAMPTSILENRLAKEELDDNRSGSRPYYKAYLAQRYLSGIEAAFHKDEGLRLCNEALDELRPGPDAGLMVQLLVLKLQNTTEGTQEYRAMAEKVMSLAPAEIRNHGLRFPVQEIGLPPELSAVLERSIFFDDPAATHAITGKMDSSGVKLSLTSPHSTKVHSANTESPAAAFDMLADMFFRQDL